MRMRIRIGPRAARCQKKGEAFSACIMTEPLTASSGPVRCENKLAPSRQHAPPSAPRNLRPQRDHAHTALALGREPTAATGPDTEDETRSPPRSKDRRSV